MFVVRLRRYRELADAHSVSQHMTKEFEEMAEEYKNPTDVKKVIAMLGDADPLYES